MQRKPLFWFLLSLLCIAGSAYYWSHRATGRVAVTVPTPSAVVPATGSNSNAFAVNPASIKPAPAVSSPVLKPAAAVSTTAAIKPDEKKLFPYRLRNTTEPYEKLEKNDRAILLMNAALDTGKSLKLSIPDSLKVKGDGGSYIVQSKGALDDNFRQLIAHANGEIVSYIPNNAYLVRVSNAGAKELVANPLTQSVVTYQPYFKIEPNLLKLVIENPNVMPVEGSVNVTLFNDSVDATTAQLKQLGAMVMSSQPSPFGPVLRINASAGTLTDVAQLPGVQGVAQWHHRVTANDLTRTQMGLTSGPLATDLNYLGLTGAGVMVNINDTGVDKTHPDLAGRLLFDQAFLGTDTDAHGTHVAGILMGNGSQSSTVTNAQGSVTNADFRGMAPDATAFVQYLFDSDGYLQTNVASNFPKIFISNNSWGYDSSFSYDIASACFDAAVRDALPGKTGTQPLCYVFSAGNQGSASDDGGGGVSETIVSPATAKNVITVGAIEHQRFIELITNIVTSVATNINGIDTNIMVTNMVTNMTFFAATDSDNQVASYSSRGNVGYYAEGAIGRFKPDVVAPGTFIISTRSTNWDQAAYYNPIFVSTYEASGMISTNLRYLPSIFIDTNVVHINVDIISNQFSTVPIPSVPIYGLLDDYPTTNNFLGTNSIVLPTNGFALNAYSSLYLGFGNYTPTSPIFVTVRVQVYYTNGGDYYTILSNINQQIAPYYRYESGTSMAAPVISGLLADMQQFFNLHNLTYSPALMKALLINSARSVGPLYDFAATSQGVNAQGWGLPNITNAIPYALTNLGSANDFVTAAVTNSPIIFLDQSTNNVLSTGQSRTYNLALSSNSFGSDFRVTLVWTDPAGNPNAGKKLVNDLDLIVTNLVTGDVYYGNDIPGGSIYSESVDTNSNVAIIDSINNIENVYLKHLASSNISITVLGRRVNVNAINANTNGVVQDYALVISSGDGGSVTNTFTGFTVNPTVAVAVNPAITNLDTLTNGLPVFNQRVGANSQFNPSLTNGTVTQWKFYVYTNTPSVTNANFTNVAFVTFVPPELSEQRMELLNEIDGTLSSATRYLGADIDIYASSSSTLTNLDPVAISNAVATGYSARGQGGTAAVLITNSTVGEVFYIGVKSEDQQAAQFDLLGVATDQPFDNTDTNGNVHVTMLAQFPVVIPGGAASAPNHALVLGVSTSTAKVRKVIVTNDVTHQDFGDLVGILNHTSSTAGKKAVLNNHTFFTNQTDLRETFVYDDSAENEIPGARHTDGPGDLRQFSGDNAGDVWMFTMVNDSSLSDTGAIQNFAITIEPRQDTNDFTVVIQGNSWYYNYEDINAAATNFTILLSQNTLPLDLYIRRGDFPDFGTYDAFKVIGIGGGSLSINKFTSPILNAGRYFYGIYNPNSTPQTVHVHLQVDYSIDGIQVFSYFQNDPLTLLDDAVVYSPLNVSNASTIISAEVGVHLLHPRESDLTLTLVSPKGTRVLLAENRGINPNGTLDGHGYGSGNSSAVSTNVSGTFRPSTNSLTLPAGSSGQAVITYTFYSIPDDMRVYYGTNLLRDTGLISGSGGFTVNYGPGVETNLTVVMNAPGSNPVATNGDAWFFTASLVGNDVSYAIFSEDPTFSPTPIKFAVPPYGAAPATLPSTNLITSDFETSAVGSYIAGSVVDGWTVTGTNPVTVVNAPLVANTGNNLLALHSGAITRTLQTKFGLGYTLTYASRARANLIPLSWWKAETNTSDSIGANSMIPLGPPMVYSNGIVGAAFAFDGPASSRKLHVDDAAAFSLQFSNSFTVEGWINPNNVNLGTIFQRGDNAGNNAYSLDFSGGSLEWYVTDTNLSRGIPATYPGSSIGTGNFVHIAATYNTNGNVKLYVNGALVNTGSQSNAPLVALSPANQPGVGIGNRGSADPAAQGPFDGLIDELSVYSRELTPVEIQHIYASGSAGKDCNVLGSLCTSPVVKANVTLGTAVKQVVGTDGWVTNSIPFTAPLDNLQLTFAPATNLDGTFQDGILLDSIVLDQDASPNPANYYVPEESLTKLAGENSGGIWQLEIMDNRLGAISTNQLVGWKLSLLLADAQPAATTLSPQVLYTNNVVSGNDGSEGTGISYFIIDVPYWASSATNILLNASLPVNVFFNQSILPTGTNAGDYELFANSQNGSIVLDTSTSIPALQPGSRYYLAVQNTNATAVTFSFEVDFNITTLFNGVKRNTSILAGNVPRYFQFDVDTNAVVAEFLILNPTGNLELVASKGAPLPDTGNFAYLCALPGITNQTIVVTTNSSPVALSPGRWYLGVFNNANANVNYTIEALEAGAPTIIDLRNGVTRRFPVPAGPALTRFFRFVNTNAATEGILFEVYAMTGNVDLTVGKEVIPYGKPYFASSTNPGTNDEHVVLRTNGIATVVTNDLTGNWYLGVPNNIAGGVTFNIRATITTNGILTNATGFKVTQTVPTSGTNGPTLTWSTLVGNCYQIQYSSDLLSSWVNYGAPVPALGPTITFTDTNAIAPSTSRFYRIVQVVCPP